MCIKEIARFFSFVALPTTLLADASWFAQKKPHTRDANATPPLRRQWSSQMLLSCGALPAVRDGLKSAFGSFFSVALCFSASLNSFFTCTADH